ncbi:KAP family NTPase [Methylobacterium sp. J-043]|jgi:hypothetical protein|uniref:KAP NTPase domain-containing protein n=1 Tax=Methylobacterium goesingense TaxID=243690 RepID=A0ABV2LB80_9HYPH|nr:MULTISPECIES: Qat anti-phage system ATPase QatA [Methylobacteriaceae]MCJ2030772.1 KAP family NTPase [Methylobacterium sp. J-043]KQP04949.1 hypothetical protein ASF28_19170 [Methylobacterium sp. Leaf99]KQT49130.1 hypothetical protein ASG52_09130 [Methylobacterium sp. Leaf456]UYW33774.1 KAP family NTPase [Methylorubrum extorquens]GJD72696.1 hypothetical protein CFIICLFH_0916 [Methylobacterium goesingense]
MASNGVAAAALVVVPDHETAVDLLYFEAIAQTVVNLIDATPNKPLTVGIHGDWGAGKSSVLRMAEARLKKREGVLCLHFDGWRFQGFDDAKTALLETIVEELRDSETFGAKTKKAAKGLLKRVRWMKLAKRGGQLAWNYASGLPSPDQVTEILGKLSGILNAPGEAVDGEALKKVVEEAKEYLAEPEAAESAVTHIRAFQKEFETLLKEAGIKKLVVLIDDLDRCLPKTAIETLEAIRLFLFTPQTAFIIATDEAMIEYAVRQHFPDLPAAAGPTSYARNYLEKLIQVPFRIPALGMEEAKVYVTLLLAQAILGEEARGFVTLVEKARAVIKTPWISNALTLEDIIAAGPDKRTELTAAYRLAQQLGPTVAEGLEGNPRQIKRFLNAVALRKAVADARGLSSEVEISVLGRVMLIERFKPDFFTQVAKQAMTVAGGIVVELKLLESDEATPPRPGGPSAGSPQADGSRTLPEAVADWAGDAWLRNWARLDPDKLLSTVDLRPYVFATRDRKSAFGRASSNALLDRILSSVGSGALGATQVDGDIRALDETGANLLFNTLKDQILAVDQLSASPPHFAGLCALVRHHPRFQGRLLDFLGELPADELGSWAAAGWSPQAFQDGPKTRARDMLRSWSTRGSRQLQITAKATLRSLDGPERR